MAQPMRRKTRGPVHQLSGPAVALLLLVLVTAGGTVGYVLVEGWSWWDAFYMTVITVTTVGYREVHTLSRAGEILTVLVLVAGVGTAFYAFTLIATIVVEGGLARRIRRRRMDRMIDELDGHFILCGFGRIGSVIADEFRQQDIPFVIVERDAERVQEALDRGMLVVEADASREEALRRLNIDRARGLVAAVGTDAENVYTILTARVLAPGLFIVGRAETEDAERKLRRAGADRVVSPYAIGAQQMAQTALRPAVVDFVKLAYSGRQPGSGDGADSGQRWIEPRRTVHHRRQSPAALRRHRRRHPAGRRAHGVQSTPRRRHEGRRSAGRAGTPGESPRAGSGRRTRTS
jgi:voltage-gated potassium channel